MKLGATLYKVRSFAGTSIKLSGLSKHCIINPKNFAPEGATYLRFWESTEGKIKYVCSLSEQLHHVLSLSGRRLDLNWKASQCGVV